MAELYVKKDGLLYSQDLSTVVGVDQSEGPFSGTVLYGAVKIVDEAFSACPVKEVFLPDSVKELGDCLFENSTELTTVTLPATISQLPPYLFCGCTSLTKVNMPAVLTAFPEGLFKGCSSMKDIPFRAGIQELPESVFEGCSSLKSLVIPNSVSVIKSRACADCTELNTVIFPAKMYELADDAFEGCNKIRNIRIDGDNHLFYVNEEDGCLYERSIEGDDKLRLKVCDLEASEVDFYEDEEKLNTTEIEQFFTDEQENEEIDEICSPEVGFDGEEEPIEVGISENETEVFNEKLEENDMDENTSEIDDLFADIMGDEKARTEVTSPDVAISDRESEVLSEMMEVMSEETPATSSVAVTDDELANLFSANEQTANDSAEEAAVDPTALDSKTQILVESVVYSKVLNNDAAENAPEDDELIVIAEKMVSAADGSEDFSEKLINCCEKIARIHDFRKVVMLYGLPLDNDEFMQFYHHFVNKKNVILACEAASASKLSDYSKQICEESRISLNKDELAQQRKSVSIKNDSLIKLVIQDI